MAELSEFEGLPVEEVGVEMPNAAGGLQDAMKFDPVEWHQGDEHYIVLKCEVKKIRFEPIEKDDFDGPQKRVHVLHVSEAAPIDAGSVKKQLSAYQERIQKAKDEAEGKLSLDLEGEGELPIGADDFEGDRDEQLRREEYELLLKEGRDPEEARAEVWGEATKEPVSA